MAETTTATSWPASTSRLTWRATLRMRSRSATDVPPNFITRRAMTFPDAPKGANKRPAVPAAKGAYTYRRGAETATLRALRASSALIFWVLDAIYRANSAAGRDRALFGHDPLGHLCSDILIVADRIGAANASKTGANRHELADRIDRVLGGGRGDLRVGLVQALDHRDRRDQQAHRLQTRLHQAAHGRNEYGQGRKRRRRPIDHGPPAEFRRHHHSRHRRDYRAAVPHRRPARFPQPRDGTLT